MLAPSVNEWMNEWLWCIEAQKCKRAWLDGKIQLDIRDQQEGQNPGEGGRASGSAKKDCIHHVVLKSWDLIARLGEAEAIFSARWQQFEFFFLMFYCVSFQPHIRVERIALMDHYAAITQLQQLATFSPSYFIYHIFFDPGQSILRQTLASCHFYLKDLDF